MLAACHAVVGRARELAGTDLPPARALIKALAIRFPQAEVLDDEIMAS